MDTPRASSYVVCRSPVVQQSYVVWAGSLWFNNQNQTVDEAKQLPVFQRDCTPKSRQPPGCVLRLFFRIFPTGRARALTGNSSAPNKHTVRPQASTRAKGLAC
jgi:hypothetical protein